MEISSYSFSKGAISVGINFNPMYRHKIFRYEPLKIFCENKIREAAEKHSKRLKFTLNEIGIEVDHVHILVTFSPDTKLWQIIKAIKGYTAREIFKAFPWLRGRLKVIQLVFCKSF